MKNQKRKKQITYASGVCNIGPEEIQRRTRYGWVWLVVAFVQFLVVVLFEVPAIWRLTIFFPVAISASGFLQARNHFCAYFGLKGIFNFGSQGDSNSVDRPQDLEQDRKKAWGIILTSLLAGVIGAFFAYYV